MEKVQIFLKPEERAALEQMAKDAGLDVSGMVRTLLRERVRENRRVRMREAAQLMADAYRTDPELTAILALVGEDVNEHIDPHQDAIRH